MNNYISIQDVQFDNNPLFILCAPHATGKTIALMNYISSSIIPCDYLYTVKARAHKFAEYIKRSHNSGLIKDYPMIHFVKFIHHGSIIEGKNFNRLIIELDELDYLDDLQTIINKAFNAYKYYQVILVSTPAKFKDCCLISTIEKEVK